MDRKQRVEGDYLLACKYKCKLEMSEKRGVPFFLTFYQYKTIMSRKTCYYTGIAMTLVPQGCTTPKGSDRTLDRIDSSIGYTVENTVACCHAANQAKSFFEQSKHINIHHLKKMLHKL